MKGEVSKRKRIFDEIYKTLLFIVSIVAITYVMPTKSKFQYQFEVGKPWQYDLLTAKKDFPIYKSSEALKEERNAIIERQHPYYNFNDSVKTTILQELISKSEVVLAPIHSEYRTRTTLNSLSKELEKFYNIGIISNDEYKRFKVKKVNNITIIKNKIGESFAFSEILSTQQVIDQLKKVYPTALDTIVPIENWEFEQWLIPNLVYNEEISLKVKNEELNSISVTSGMVQAGERIIDKGEIVTPEIYQIIESIEKENQQEDEQENTFNTQLTTTIGQVALVLCFIFFLYLYMRLFRPQYFAKKRIITLLLGMIVTATIITATVVKYNSMGVYIIPYALILIISSIFFDTRTGLYAFNTTILVNSLLVPAPFEFMLLQIAVGMVCIATLRNISQRSQLVNAAICILITYSIIYLGYSLAIGEGQINAWTFAFFGLNGILLLLVYPFVYIIELSFGFISNMRLIELSDINSPLMRKLSEDAPGTFQHSMQVANLASDIANKLGGNPMLARTGALYHDIGKIQNPAFFVENQAKGNNPHQYLTPEASAQIIRQHVSDGVRMAKDARLPNSIVEFIETHHGLSMTRYFYNEWCNNHPNEKPDAAQFTYQGPNPHTKEMAIVMLCDTIEAASRSLNEYTDESIDNLVEKLVNGIVAEHYLDNAPITLREITTAKEILKEKLANIYHTRIAYPELKKDVETKRN